MKHHTYFINILIISFLGILPISCQNTIDETGNTVGVILNSANSLDGYTLFTVHTETYLINNCGEVVKQWTSNYSSGKSVYLFENGNLLRAAEIPNPGKIIIPGIGGRVELFNWDGSLIWEYNYSTATASQHHDIFPMPNGNVLMLAATVINETEAIQMGRKLVTPPFKQLYSEQILELKPKGSNDADIVWEWNIRDHLIQDVDNTKDNYGDVGKNPQRLDVNFLGTTSGGANWLHINSMQYNAELDQIILSSRHMNEIYIIDHSTTTTEAATDSGGTFQKGGDLLYRWGNPIVYRQGTTDDQMLFGQHTPYWIEEGHRDAGKIMLFNNGVNRSPEYSEIFVLSPPTRAPGSYTITANADYGPKKPDYIYTATIQTDFYSEFVSNAQRLPNGNTFICEGEPGHFFEIDSNENIVWDYINPVGASEILSQGENPDNSSNIVFRAIKYSEEYAGFEGRDLTPGLPIEKSPDLTRCIN